MKKILTFLTVIALVVALGGCRKQTTEDTTVLLLPQDEVKSSVNTWPIYTNPAFRYELRFPKDWQTYQPNESGEEVTVYPKSQTLGENYVGALKIFGLTNWVKNLTLEQYMEEKGRNLYKDGNKMESIEFKGYTAYWFKDVTSIYKDKTVQVVLFQMSDRIVEVHLIDEWEDARLIFNNMYFYGDNTIEIDPIQ
jgi:hypothetical protein